MLEIYNETIHDLLSSDTENKLNIKLNTDGLYVPGLTQVSVSNLDEVNMVIQQLLFCMSLLHYFLLGIFSWA